MSILGFSGNGVYDGYYICTIMFNIGLLDP